MRPEPAAIGNLFGREDAINADRCLNCRDRLSRERISMWPMETQREYQRSGLCRRCQVVAFEEDLTTCTCGTPCCEADIGVGVINCGTQHCPIHGNDS